ncbi:MAG: acetylxylan esterase [Burkholderiales bacterium]|nr:acetylxylan esterase [Burkholderiales bacterium]
MLVEHMISPRLTHTGSVKTIIRTLVMAPWAMICLTLPFPVSAQDTTTSIIAKERVSFQSGSLRLEGLLLKPGGVGPHPGIVWNHGSEKNPDAGQQIDAVAAIFVPAGFAVFAPLRRGHGNSEGLYIGDELKQARFLERNRLQVRLLEGEQFDDQLAGLAFFKGLPFVDQRRVAVAGCSYGGIQSPASCAV